MRVYLEQLAKSIGIARSFREGATILYQGEAPRSACVLLEGVVRVYSISPSGDDQIVSLHTAGEFFPAAWVFGKARNTLFFYEALTDCQVAFVPKSELVTYMTADADRNRALLDYFTTNYAASLIRINALEQPKARDKLVYTLYFLCQRYASDSSNSKLVEVPLVLTHQHLASMVGLTRETTAMEMSKLKKQRVISYHQQHYSVNMDKLMEIIGEESFRELSIGGGR